MHVPYVECHVQLTAGGIERIINFLCGVNADIFSHCHFLVHSMFSAQRPQEVLEPVEYVMSFQVASLH